MADQMPRVLQWCPRHHPCPSKAHCWVSKEENQWSHNKACVLGMCHSAMWQVLWQGQTRCSFNEQTSEGHLCRRRVTKDTALRRRQSFHKLCDWGTKREALPPALPVLPALPSPCGMPESHPCLAFVVAFCYLKDNVKPLIWWFIISNTVPTGLGPAYLHSLHFLFWFPLAFLPHSFYSFIIRVFTHSKMNGFLFIFVSW